MHFTCSIGLEVYMYNVARRPECSQHSGFLSTVHSFTAVQYIVCVALRVLLTVAARSSDCQLSTLNLLFPALCLPMADYR